MKRMSSKILLLLWVFTLLLSRSVTAQQPSFFDVTSLNAKYNYTPAETPDNLVPVNSFTSLAIGYQWESSTQPLDGFTNLSSGTNATYSFPSGYHLPQTTYFRCKLIWIPGIGRPYNLPEYTNTIRLELVSANWENLNYTRETTVLIPGLTSWQSIDNLSIGDKLQTTHYADGLGRDLQTVSRETATPDASQPTVWGDIVTFSEYDQLGRMQKNYLPYSTTLQPGKFKTSAISTQAQYYQDKLNETYPYSEKIFDALPVDRTLTVKSPGYSWHNSAGNTLTHDINDASDNVQIFNIGYLSTDLPVNGGAYAANKLFKDTHIDDNGKQSITYSNKNGQVILAKVELTGTHADAYDGWICTYSVYDDFGLLRFRIQPEGVKWLAAHGWSFAASGGSDIAEEYCFRYMYDEKGRNISKKAPGAKELYTVYDQRDRVIFTQDGNQRLKTIPEWTANLYDELDRPTITTLYTTTKTISQLQTDIVNSQELRTTTVTNQASVLNNLVLHASDANTNSYLAQDNIELMEGFETAITDDFTAEIYPSAVKPAVVVNSTNYKNPISDADMVNSAVTTILKYYFYDNYSYNTAKTFSNLFDNSIAYTTGDPIVATQRTTNMITGIMSRVLGTNTFLTTTVYYDEKERRIQSLEDNIKDGQDITTTQYQFDGRVLSTSSIHSAGNTGYDNFKILTKNSFDKIGRISQVQKFFNGQNAKTITSYSYDDLGRLKTKALDPDYLNPVNQGIGLEKLEYDYNIQGALTGINKDYALKTPGKYNKWNNYFGLYLGYDNRDNMFNAAQLDGHITGALWTTMGDDAQRKYDFSYDNAGRLINAVFKEKQLPGDSWANNKMDFSVSGHNGQIEYDLNGNLIYMLQKGIIAGETTPKVMDDLHYLYDKNNLSNRLVRVTDNGNMGTANGKLGDFADGSNPADDYVYDDNGNLVIDLNKNVKDLAGLSGGQGIKYNYLDKPEEIRIAGKGTIKIVYDADGNKLQKIFTPEGSSTPVTTTYINDYVYKGDDLQYINFEEGRIRVIQPVLQGNGIDVLTIVGNLPLPLGKSGAFDFFIRDYQGNVRMILTEEGHLGINMCTLEPERAANEENIFGKTDANGNPASGNEVQARFAKANIPGQSGGGGWQSTLIGNYVSRLGNLAGQKVGPNALLKVMAGDRIDTRVAYYYQNAVTNQSASTTLLNDLLLSLGNALSGNPVASGITHGAGTSTLTSPLNSSLPFSGAIAPDANNANGSNPKAYLTILFFDERFNFIAPVQGQEGSSSLRVQTGGTSSNGASLQMSNRAPKNGYAYVYISNESDETVYFDNLQVFDTHGPILEENHYYAYGLKIAGISSRKLQDASEGHVNNKNLYNDKEQIDDADLDWLDYGFRNYDAQIGRFVQMDPLADDNFYLSPYQYGACDPIMNIDEDGLDPVPSNVFDFAASVGGTIMHRGDTWLVNFIKNGAVVTSTFKTLSSSMIDVARALAAPALKAAITTAATVISNSTKVTAPVGTEQTQKATPNKLTWCKGFMQALDDYTPEQRLQDARDWDNFQHGRYEGLSPEKLKTYNRYKQAQEEWKSNSMFVVQMLLLPTDIEGGIAIYNLGRKGLQFAIKKFTTSAATRRVFWSGGKEAMRLAQEFAIKNNMTTLEMTRAGKNLAKLTEGMPWEEAAPMWERLSRAFARGAKGPVHVFQNANGIRLQSVWAKSEYTILKGKNDIIFHNVFNP